MFPAEKKGEWEPLKIRERKIVRQSTTNERADATNGDTKLDNTNGAGDAPEPRIDAEEEVLYEEDPTTEEGAVFPLEAGRVVNWSCFFALLTHIFNTLSPPFHTPILVVSQPAWTAKDHERLAQFFFEKFKTPGFCLMDSALAVSYAYATPTATVVDIGHDKCDITAVSDFVVSDIGRVIAMSGCGGEGFTQRLLELLVPKGFTKDMCEQLKRSALCEILPPGVEMPVEDGYEDRPVVNPASAASTGANGPGYGFRGSTSAQGGITGALAAQTVVDDDEQDRDVREVEENEGVLDVASIVVSGKTSEWVAKKEKEKAEKAAAKKAAADAATPKLARLPNSKRAKVTFHYNERRPLDDLDLSGQPVTAGPESNIGKRQKTPELGTENVVEGETVPMAPRKEERQRRRTTETVALIRKDIEVGIERFQAASGGILDQIVDSIHRCILSVPEIVKRSELWDSIIIVGNGSKVKGISDPEVVSFLSFSKMLTVSPLTPSTNVSGRNRPERRNYLDPQRKIPHISLQRHDIYLGTSLQFHHARCDWDQHPATATTSTIISPCGARGCQPSSPCCHYGFQSPSPAGAVGAAATTPAVLPAAVAANLEPDSESLTALAFGSRANAY